MVDLKWDSVLFSKKKTVRDWKAVVFFCLSCISFFLDYGYIFMCFQEQQINDDNDHERITHAYYSFKKKKDFVEKTERQMNWLWGRHRNIVSVFKCDECVFSLLVYLILFQQSRYNHKRWRYKHERRMESEWGALCRHAHFLTIWNSMKFHGMNSRAEKEKKLYT